MAHLFPDFPALVFSDTAAGEGGLQGDVCQNDTYENDKQGNEEEFGKKRAFEQKLLTEKQTQTKKQNCLAIKVKENFQTKELLKNKKESIPGSSPRTAW